MPDSLLQCLSDASRSDEIHQVTTDSTVYPDNIRNLLAKCTHLDLTERTVEIGGQIAHGGTSDLFLGSLRLENGKECRVAIKRLRIYAMRNGKSEKVRSLSLNIPMQRIDSSSVYYKALVKELYIWSNLNHPRILRLEGLYVVGNYPYLISPWMINGTALGYLERNPCADVVHMVPGITEGIAYLHTQKIVHSDIKPDNVLINDFGEPLLCDFGMSRMLEKPESYPISNTTTTDGVRGTIRYMSKELFKENASLTESSDIWAFGMTVYTLLTRHQPFENLTTEVQVLLAIVDGTLPSWPEDIGTWPIANQSLSRMCQRCWEEPVMRPDIGTLLRELRQLNRHECATITDTTCVEKPLKSQGADKDSVFAPGRFALTNTLFDPSAILLDENSPRRRFEATGTAQHMSSDRLRCDFAVDGYRMTFDASTSLGLPQFSSKPARILYDDADELTGTQGYSGFVGVNSFTLTLDNGTVIIGYLDASHQESMNRILGSGIWIST
ncbi:hypothetical protein ACEPAH_3163 [Sanghuangporus vaninii]